MQQPVPVADLVDRRAAEVVPVQWGAEAGERRAQDVAAVEDVRGGGRLFRHAGGRQRAVPEEDAAGGDAGGAGGGDEVGLVVDVEGAVGAFAEGDFHGAVVAVGRPGVVCGAVGAHVAEADAGVDVGVLEARELVCDHGVGDVFG